jgi:hypothetical protein
MRTQQIKEMAEEIYHNFNCQIHYKTAEDIAQHLYNMGYHKQDKWISVDDKLPENTETYLVHYHDDITGEYVTTRQYWANARKFAPMDFFEKHTGRKAMHWMPLPTPPIKKGEIKNDK